MPKHFLDRFTSWFQGASNTGADGHPIRRQRTDKAPVEGRSVPGGSIPAARLAGNPSLPSGPSPDGWLEDAAMPGPEESSDVAIETGAIPYVRQVMAASGLRRRRLTLAFIATVGGVRGLDDDAVKRTVSQSLIGSHGPVFCFSAPRRKTTQLSIHKNLTRIAFTLEAESVTGARRDLRHIADSLRTTLGSSIWSIEPACVCEAVSLTASVRPLDDLDYVCCGKFLTLG